MKSIIEYPFEIPSEFGTVHFADLYTLAGFSSFGRTVEQLATLLFEIPVPGTKALLWVRDLIVRPLGLKTSSSLHRKTGDRIAGFHVLDRSEDCLILGENDYHLDFRVYMKLMIQPDGLACLHLSTVVHYNNWLGKLYFVPVRPVHRFIVGCMVRRARKLLGASIMKVQ